MKLRSVGGALAAVVLLAAIAWASAVEIPTRGDIESALRLSWSARPERIESCRKVSEEELAKLPVHMRMNVECEGILASYLLTVMVDDDSVDRRVVRGGGMRNDRPIHLLVDYPIAAGSHRVRIMLTRQEAVENDSTDADSTSAVVADTGLFDDRAARESNERTRLKNAELPVELVLDTVVEFKQGAVVLVGYDTEARRLQLRANY